MLVDLGGEAVTVLTAPDSDWTTPQRRTVTTLAPLEPRSADASIALDSGWNLYLPEDDPIGRLDRVEVRGRIYTVRSTPDVWAGTCLVAQVSSVDRNATVSLHTPSSSGWSDANEATVATPGTVYASSVTARVQAVIVRSDNDVVVAEEALTRPPYIITIDHDVEPNEGDEVEVTACPADPSVVGRFFRIDRVARGVEGVDRELRTVLVDVPASTP